MTAVLRKYRALVIIISLLLFALLMWIFLSRQNTVKIPARGVFVLNGIKCFNTDMWRNS